MPPPPSPPSPPPSDSALYRRVWRWHFYAGLVCLPFLALMAITGALYLFKEDIDSALYGQLRFVQPGDRVPLDAESLILRAQAAVPGEAVRFIGPAQPDRSVEVGVRTGSGTVSVYLDPADGRVLGQLQDERKLMEVVRQLHSLAIAGPVANLWIEIVAGWAIVLVVSGVFLWWPRGRSGGVVTVRGRPGQRVWWRDLHAVTGVFASVAILFLAVTGMPWSAFWGQQFSQLTQAWDIGLPRHLFGPGPLSGEPLARLGTVPWTLTQVPLPASAGADSHDSHGNHGSHDGHDGHDGQRSAPASPSGPPLTAPSLGLNEALRTFTRLGLPAGTPVALPQGPRGVYTAMQFPDDVRQQRVVHLDRYTGAVLSDVGYPDYGVAGRVVEWGVNLHTGVQFGRVNQFVMLAGCLSIVALAISAGVMWWKRRPRGRLAAPPRRQGDRAARSALVVAAVLGLLYPLLGASMLAALLIDTALPTRWRERFGL